MKWIKWVLIFLVSLFILALGSIYFLFNPAVQKLKPEIVKTLSKSIGTEVTVGEISAQLLPSPKIELTNLSVAGARGAKLKKLLIDSSISELLSGELAISDVTIDEPAAEIVKLADGSLQIGDLKIGGKKGEAHGDPSPTNPPTASAKKTVAIKINKLSVTNGSFVYSEEGKEQKLAIGKASLALSNFSPNVSSPIKFAFSLFGKSSENFYGEGTIVLDSFKTNSPLASLLIKLSDLDLEQATRFVKASSAPLSGIDANGTLKGQLQLDGKPEGLKVNLELDATSAGITVLNKEERAVVNKTGETLLTLSADGVLRPTKVFNLNSFDLKLGQSLISGSSEIDLNDKVDKVKKLNINVQKLNVTDISKVVAVPALNSGTFTGNLSLDLSKKPIPEMEGTIDITGVDLESSNVSGLSGKLLLKKNLVSTDSLDLNYKGESVKLTGDLLQYNGNQLDTPGIKVALLGGVLQIENRFLNEGNRPFSGSVTGNGIDLRRLVALNSTLPPYSVNGILNKIDATFKGTAQNVKEDLASSFSIGITKGEIIGVNLIGGVFQKIGSVPGLGDSLVQLVPEKYRPLVSAANSTSFDAFNLDGTLNSGTEIILSKAELIHQAYSILGTGRASTKGSLDLKTQMKITKEVTEGMVARNGKLQLLLDKENSLTFPLLISKGDGPVIVLPDVSELGKNALRNTAKDAASKALDKVAPGLGTGASKLLNKLF